MILILLEIGCFVKDYLKLYSIYVNLRSPKSEMEFFTTKFWGHLRDSSHYKWSDSKDSQLHVSSRAWVNAAWV